MGERWCNIHQRNERVGYGHAVVESTSAAHALPVQAPRRHVVESVIEEGYEVSGHLSAIRNSTDRRFIARMLPTWQAEAAVWAINRIAAGYTLVAVKSRFQVGATPSFPDAGPHFYEGPTPEER